MIFINTCLLIHILKFQNEIKSTLGIFLNQGTLGTLFKVTLSIYKFGLSFCLFVCLSVCLYPINVKTAEPIGPIFFVGHHVTTGKVYE